jgi:hypothetical protein
MTSEREPPPLHARPVFRLVTASLGALLLVVAIVGIAIQETIGWPAALVSLVLAVLGIDAIVGAARGTEALVTRLGPFP